MLDDDNADDRILVTKTPRELLAGGFTDKPVEYTRVYRGCLSARFPAEQNAVGRWSIRRRDLPAVAAALGLTPVSHTSAPAIPDGRSARLARRAA